MGRRGNKEGSIYKRKDGRWCAYVTMDGHRVQKYSKTKSVCAKWLKETLTQIDQGLTIRGTQYTVQTYLEEWLVSIKSSLRKNTWLQYKQNTYLHIIPFLGEIKLKDLRPDQIQSLYNSKQKNNIGAATIRISHAILHKSLNQAVKWGLMGRNPADAVTRPRETKHEMSVLNLEQVKSLLSFLVGSRFEALYYLALTTGLREGELLGLKWNDLDWGSSRLQIKRQLQRIPHEGLHLVEPKSKAGRRAITLGYQAVEKLRGHNELQQKERLFAGERWQENDLIFPSTIGTPMEPRNLIRFHDETLAKIGLPPIRFHDLRHTAATLMLLQGTNPKIVQERLGHASIQLTMDTYSHVLPDMQSDIANRMDALLTPIPVSLTPKK